MLSDNDWEELVKMKAVVLIGKGTLSDYLWNLFCKANNTDEIGLQFHEKYLGTARSLIDGLRNFGWVQEGQTWTTMVKMKDKESGEPYEVLMHRALVGKLGAIRGL